ncbi:cytochrome P450 [Colletotrichum zoysiae]|uniref:Cytochrome P450 n=1 Tax=Colletotrichum zoysiae TaxID=1216348 RepID=A0AAD9LZP2_9PEZI|nr:cytochrome P450 [Colletotrichum zoysiae]
MMRLPLNTEYYLLAGYAAAAVLAFQLLRAVYRLHFHPLSKFPGPRSAAISDQWQAKLTKLGYPEPEYEKLHADFDTKALRIGPNKLHLSDTSLYKLIYSQANPFLKEKDFYDAFGSLHSLFVESDPHLHKERRKLLNPLFSKSGVLKLEPLMVEKAEELKLKIKRVSKAGSINVANAFRCMTVDVITEFAFGKCANLTNEHPTSFDAEFLEVLHAGGNVPPKIYYSTITRLLTKWVPLSVAANFSTDLRRMADLLGTAARSHDEYTRRTTNSKFPVIFDYLQSVPDHLQKLEAIDILIAGSDTSAFTLTTALYHILSMPEVEKALVESLDQVIGKSQTLPSLLQLEKIKYLRACVNEALRVAMPVPGMLPRIVPKQAQPLIVDGKVIPPGTIVGISAYTMHTDPEIWGSDAKSFNPARWLGPDAKQLETNIHTFSKGLRQCIGINIAYAEVTMTLALLFHDFKMELKTKELHLEDRFTTEVLGPVLVDFKPRQHS